MAFTDPHELSHGDDPESSHSAARGHVRSGNHEINANMVRRLVRRHPGKTACELWDLARSSERAQLKELQEVRRRLTDNKKKGLIREGAPRRCTVRGTTQVVWNFAAR